MGAASWACAVFGVMFLWFALLGWRWSKAEDVRHRAANGPDLGPPLTLKGDNAFALERCYLTTRAFLCASASASRWRS